MKKLETKSTVLLKHHLKSLKMPTMYDECEKIAVRCSKENVDHLGTGKTHLATAWKRPVKATD